MKDLRLLSEDRRRGRVRPTRLALVGGGVILVLAVALIAFGIRRIQAGGQMRPVVTPTAAMAIPPTENAAQVSEPISAPGGCPTDRGEWHLVPYNLPGNDAMLYAIDPPCVMEQVERAFLEYLAAYREHGRNWTAQDHEQFYSPAGFTAPLSGDTVHELTEPPALSCVEEVNPDGTPPQYPNRSAVLFSSVTSQAPYCTVSVPRTGSGRESHLAGMGQGKTSYVAVGWSGKCTVKVLPSPGTLWTVTSPPWARANSRAMARPRPAPPSPVLSKVEGPVLSPPKGSVLSLSKGSVLSLSKDCTCG